MKLRFITLALLFIGLFPASLILAQEPASTIESLYVAFWPDYDDPSVLVLMTGTLPADVSLPAEVTIPLPPGAEINAVARVGDEGMADTQFEVVDNVLTLITPDPRFRVEYYAPYAVDGDQRTFDFAWDADLAVQEFTAEVQQPVNATGLTTQPPAATVGTGPNDGLTYHALPSQSLPAGTPFALSFRYDMENPGLTAVGDLAPPAPNTAPAAQPTAPASGIDWLLIAAGAVIILLLIVVTWMAATRNSAKPRRSGKSNKPRKPAPKERSAATTAFCHNCGARAEKGDVFCRKCGTALK